LPRTRRAVELASGPPKATPDPGKPARAAPSAVANRNGYGKFAARHRRVKCRAVCDVTGWEGKKP
jgi:hypothetical protein